MTARTRTSKTSRCRTFEPKHFTFKNGDTYTGEFMIDSDNKLIYRNGNGTYASPKLGIKITGNWIKDKLSGEATIEYGAQKFEGFLGKNMEYTVGQFDFADGSKFCGDFKKNFDNRRLDGVQFFDPNCKKWNHSLTDENDILLEFDWQQDQENCQLTCDKLKETK